MGRMLCRLTLSGRLPTSARSRQRTAVFIIRCCNRCRSHVSCCVVRLPFASVCLPAFVCFRLLSFVCFRLLSFVCFCPIGLHLHLLIIRESRSSPLRSAERADGEKFAFLVGCYGFRFAFLTFLFLISFYFHYFSNAFLQFFFWDNFYFFILFMTCLLFFFFNIFFDGIPRHFQ